MLDLSPIKVLIVLVVALVVLGPDKLPQLARQLGAAWGDFRRWRARVESEVRGSFPDLPSTAKITDAVRSPLGFLDRLADEHERERERERSRQAEDESADGDELGATNGSSSGGSPARSNGTSANGSGADVPALGEDGGRANPEERRRVPSPPADPSMN